MITVLTYLIALIVGYLLGSISNAVMVAKAHGVNIFEVGSGNPGATNVKRSISSKAGNLVFFLDLLKGMIATLLPTLAVYMGIFSPEHDYIYYGLACLAGALIGHSFSLYIGFRGGKGVATAMGGMIAIMPLVVVSGGLIWVATFYISRYVSLASILFALSMPIITGILFYTGTRLYVEIVSVHFILALGVALLIIIRHYPNIQRLLNGTENKFAKKKPEA